MLLVKITSFLDKNGTLININNRFLYKYWLIFKKEEEKRGMCDLCHLHWRRYFCLNCVPRAADIRAITVKLPAPSAAARCRPSVRRLPRKWRRLNFNVDVGGMFWWRHRRPRLGLLSVYRSSGDIVGDICAHVYTQWPILCGRYDTTSSLQYTWVSP